MLTFSDAFMVVSFGALVFLAVLFIYGFKQTGVQGHLTAALSLTVVIWANYLYELLEYFVPQISESPLVSLANGALTIVTLTVILFAYLQFNIDFSHHLGLRGFISFQLGFHYYSRKKLGSLEHNARKAVFHFTRALDSDPEAAAVYFYRGLSWAGIDEIDKAISDLVKSLALDPSNPYAWANKGFWLSKVARHEEAVEDYERAIEIDPTDVFSWAGKGCSLSELGDDLEALVAFDKAVELDPRLSQAWQNKGIALNRLSRHGEAVKALNRAILLEPDNGNAWAVKGHSLEMLGKSAEASKSYDRAQDYEAELESD